MQIQAPHGPNGVSPIFPTRSTAPANVVRPAQLEVPQDDIQISPQARMLDEITQSGAVRHEKIDEVRRMIASGVYETPEKLAIAVDRMLDRLQTEA
jgi:anti-sigma28 factor (negative regulator of flagellin synthesis)